jgi:serralysin
MAVRAGTPSCSTPSRARRAISIGSTTSIRLDNKIFTELGSGSASRPKTVTADMFVKDSKAQDREDRIVYDRTSGALSYDADGTGAAAPVKIASLGKNLKLAHQDFFVV